MLLETLVHYSQSAQKDQPVKYAIIWLHGLGADNRNFLELIPYLKLNTQERMKIIFPQAPDRVITANGYMSMPGWYDIKGWDLNSNMIQPDFEGMKESIQQVHALIQQEISQGILPENIIVGGFSQGGVIGLLSTLTYPQKLSGAFGLSCYLPNLMPFKIDLPLKTNQIFMAHGIHDQIVPYLLGEAAKIQLTSAMGAITEWHTYPIEHTINLEETEALGNWINTQLNLR